MSSLLSKIWFSVLNSEPRAMIILAFQVLHTLGCSHLAGLQNGAVTLFWETCSPILHLASNDFGSPFLEKVDRFDS
ncbi:hypothetical protein [Nocardiopsis synnemataformans]|uniref:hypothetical protein n=1 Tax=Nocardiopsis synnemataformans TaxID=61305 RepID=UPI003EBC5261